MSRADRPLCSSDRAMLESLFHVLLLATLIGVPGYAWLARGRTYAIFAAVILAFSFPGMFVVHGRFADWLPAALVPALHLAFAASTASAALHLVHLVRARLRGRVFRLLVSIPGQVTVAAGFMTGFWLLTTWPLRALAGWQGWTAVTEVLHWLDFAPFLVAGASVLTSRRTPEEVVRVRLGADGPADLTRLPVERYVGSAPHPLGHRPLRIVQIADPHLGPWQSVRFLRRRIEGLLEQDPDLVLLTGDYLTMEGNATPGALQEALDPLRKRAGDCYAIFGNHDHEAPELVRAALDACGVRLLVDETVCVDTPAGRVQLVGADYVGRGRREHLATLLAEHPREPGALRLLLLHDPLGFDMLPEGDVDLVLSGHTHGGQVGLVSLGLLARRLGPKSASPLHGGRALDWTVLARSRWPDHGLFARGRSRLYVHRGTGFYGFPLRVGVPGEASVLEVVLE